MIPAPFNYRAKIVRVVDGDTVIMEIDLGFHVTANVSVRLLGVDAAESYRGTPSERERGHYAKTFVESWVYRNARTPEVKLEWPFVLSSSKGHSFGRWLGRVWAVASGEELSQVLLDSGHGTPLA